MPREDCTLVTRKSVYTFTAHQKHFTVFGRKSYALTLLPIGNDLGRRPGYGISSSPNTGAMVGLFVFVGFFSQTATTYALPFIVYWHGQGIVIASSFSSNDQSIRVLTDSD
jgi:hypothetical protein